MVFDCLINEVQPFSTVEKKSFCKIGEGLSVGRTPVSRKTLMMNIDKIFQNMKEAETEMFQDGQNGRKTTEVWTAYKRGFIGITRRCIESDTLDRKSAAHACERIRRCHTYDLIAAKISQVNSDFHIQGKLVLQSQTIGAIF